MPSIRTFFFPEERPAERLDTYLSECLPDISRSQLKKLTENHHVSIAGTPAKAGLKLKGGETITVVLPDPEPTAARPEDIPLTIVYEDPDLIVINKPAGLVVHPAAGHMSGTLVNALLHHCGDLAGIGGELRPGIVHRIDKDTSGLLVVTKNDQSHQHLAQQFKRHSIQRRYLALVHGCPEQESGTIDRPIGRHPVQRKKMSVRARRTKTAVTHWKVLQRFSATPMSLIQLHLETGRTHQIRVHFAALNFPLVADPVYGNAAREAALKDSELRSLIARLPGQALHAEFLGFIHPRTGKCLEFFCEMPETLKQIVNYLNRNC